MIRDGSREPTEKVLAKLAVAEKKAGIVPPDDEIAETTGKVNDHGATYGEKTPIDERVEKLEAETAELREQVARLYEAIAAGIRRGGSPV